MTGWCKACGGICRWLSCPTGGWWAHLVHPDDNHSVDSALATPHEWMNDEGSWEDDSETPRGLAHQFVRMLRADTGWVAYCRCDYETPVLAKDDAWSDIGDHACRAPGGVFEILGIEGRQ